MRYAWKNQVALGIVVTALLSACNDEGILNLGDAASGVPGVAAVSSAGLDFGPAACGGEAPATQSFTIQNDGDGPLTWSAALDSTEYFSLGGTLAGTLAVGQSATVQVSAGVMPKSAVAGSVKLGSVVVSTNDPDRASIVVPLRATAQGATIELLAPSLGDFGAVPVGQQAPAIPITLRNVGNAPAKVALASSSDPQFGFEWTGGPDAVEVAPGATMAGVVATFKPTSNAQANSAAVLEVDGPVCGASATTVPLKGQGLSGTVGYSPAMFDLGKTSCNTQAPSQLLVVYNTGNLVYAWNAKFKVGKSYTVTPSSGVVQPGESAQVTVTPQAIGMTTTLGDNGFGDTLVVSTSVPGDQPHEIPVKQSAMGAILKWNATPLDFGSVPYLTESTGKLITITNEGNAAAAVKVAGSDAIVGTGGAVPGGGGTLISTVKYKATVLGAQTAQMELQTSDAICQPLPAKVGATGAGRGVAATMSINGNGRTGGGQMSGCIVMKDTGGKVACFGQNAWGQLGTTNTAEVGPVIVAGLPEIVQVASGDRFHCGRGKDGTVWCWGLNQNNRGNRTGILGTMALSQSHVPQQIPNLANVVDIAAGHNMACAVRMDGTAACWGTNRRMNLGTGNTGAWYNAPQELPGVTNATQIAAGSGGGCVRLNDNSARCWGYYRNRSLGNGSTCANCQSGPTGIALGNVLQVMRTTEGARFGSGCAVDTAGNLYCWGCRNYCRIGSPGCGGRCCGGNGCGHTMSLNLSGVVEAKGLWWGGCALMNDKTVRCWGRNDDGYVGNGGTGNVCGPQTVQNLANVEVLAAGGRGACAIVTGGSVKCWGNYGAGSSFTPTALRYF